MSRNNDKRRMAAERKYERELDKFLRKINAAPSVDILTELKKSS